MICNLFNFCPQSTQSRRHGWALVGLTTPNKAVNAFLLPKFSKISFAFNIFVPIPVQEMIYLKAIQKNHPNGHFWVGNHRSKNVSEKN